MREHGIVRRCPLWLLLSVALLSGVASTVAGQARVITGRVHTRSGTPISEAHVRSVLYQSQAITDAAGAFRLRLPAAAVADTLRVERLGFASVKLPFESTDSATHLDVEMSEVAIRLDEVITTATAGTQTRRAQGGVVATIPVRQLLQTRSLQTLPEVLLGRVTSLDVTPSSGSSGEAQRIWLRGATSIALSNEPIVFVDGIRADARIQRLLPNPGGQASSRLFDLDPADIDYIEVVKGPAAAAIYGADASAGVIQVFTRRGAMGREKIAHEVQIETGRFDANYRPPDNFGRCGAADTTTTSAAVLCRGLTVGSIVRDNPLQRAGLLRAGGLRAMRWSATGGGSNFGVYVALSSSAENGTLPQNEFDRHAFRVSSRWMPNPSLVIEPGFALLRSKTAQPRNGDTSDGILLGATLGNPVTVGTRTDGAFGTALAAVATIDQILHVTRATPTLRIAHDVGPLHQRVAMGVDATNSMGRYFVPLRSDNAFAGALAGGIVREDHQSQELLTVDYLGTLRVFETSSGITNRVTAGAQYVDISNANLTAIGRGLISNFANRVDDATTREGFQSSGRTRSLGMYVQDELALRDRLFLQLALRGDRHSAFGSTAGAQLYPKLGASYVVVDDEARQHMPSVISTLRLRSAFGRSGRAPRQGQAGVTYGAAAAMTGPTTVSPGLTPRSPGNPKLRPERGSELELGTDVGLFEDRMALELTFFNKRVRDLLTTIPQRPSLGFPQSPLGNLGSIRDRGVEATLRWRGEVAGRHIDSHVGVFTLSNTVLDLNPITSWPSVRYQRGKPIAAMFDYRIVQIDTTAGRVIVSDSVEYVSPSIPTGGGFFGATINITRAIRLHTDFDGKWGYRQHNVDSDLRDRLFRNSERALRPEALDTVETLRRFGPFVTDSGRPVSAAAVLGPYLQDASFVRWRQLSLTFDVSRWTRGRLGGNALSATIAAQNLKLWTRFDGDPEIVTYISENANGGAVQYAQPILMTMPQSQRWTARLDLRF